MEDLPKDPKIAGLPTIGLVEFKVDRMIRIQSVTSPLGNILVGALAITYLSGCVTINAYREPAFAVVETYFATDRNLTGKAAPSKKFGVKRAEISYAVCEVSMPRDHRMGHLESPSILRLEWREDPEKHVVLLDTKVTTKEEFFKGVQASSRRAGFPHAFLFVHGYNVSFEDAARRTAQMSYDLNFQGTPVFYSWPSQGKARSYIVDEQNIEWSEANLREFLDDFLRRTRPADIYLIAHSMGNRGLTRAVASLLEEKPHLAHRIDQLILTAPDIDADVFRRDISPAITGPFDAIQRSAVTLYASSEDTALAASKKVHGYARAGDTDRGVVVIPGIETIDATGTDTSFLKHSYFAEVNSVISDMYYLIRHGLDAESRGGLRAVETPEGPYWEFAK